MLNNLIIMITHNNITMTFFIVSEMLNPELVAAASAAAATLPNRSQAESELLRQLRRHETVSEAQKKGDVSNLGYVLFCIQFPLCRTLMLLLLYLH